MELEKFFDDNNTYLEYGVLKAHDTPSKLLVLIHGYGADCCDLCPFAEVIRDKIPNLECILPNGFDNCEVEKSYRQWFSMKDWDIDFLKKSINSAGEKFSLFLNHIAKKYNMQMSDIILLGFSQGAMMALHNGIKDNVLGVLGFSGMFVDDDILKNKKDIPTILMIHGDSDNVVPLSSLINSLDLFKDHGFELNYEIIKRMEHMIDSRALECGIKFLKSII